MLYSEAVNTFRVITYLWDGEVFHVPLALRIGQGGSYLDNAHAGGMFIGVNDLGELNDEAFTEFGKRYKEHPDTHTVFKGYKLNFVPELIKTAKKLHLNAPQLGIISWDLTVDQNGVFVLIEANTRGQSIWFPQMANGLGMYGLLIGTICSFAYRTTDIIYYAHKHILDISCKKSVLRVLRVALVISLNVILYKLLVGKYAMNSW